MSLRDKELTAGDKIAAMTCGASALELLYWLMHTPGGAFGDLFRAAVCLVLAASIGVSALGWLLQRNGPSWSRTIGWLLMGIAGAALVLCTGITLV